MITKQIGKNTLGSGGKMQVKLKGYERSTHDLGYLWRSTMAAGTIVPFLTELALPGDTFDIDLDCDIKTHPTIGPLFGSFKVQLDVFTTPIRLYNGLLQNNTLNIGLKMSDVKLPQLILKASATDNENINDNSHVNPSCILSYLNIRGIGLASNDWEDTQERQFNAVPYLIYWDVYKNYYANKQEEYGAVIHNPRPTPTETIDLVAIQNGGGSPQVIVQHPITGSVFSDINSDLIINYTGVAPTWSEILLNTDIGQFTIDQLYISHTDGTGTRTYHGLMAQLWMISWQYAGTSVPITTKPTIKRFLLTFIDQMRKQILTSTNEGTIPAVIDGSYYDPYGLPLQINAAFQTTATQTQEGLALKTYQSDMFNNWMREEWISGTNGISEITAIDTSDGSFTIDTLILSRKVYDMMNRIAISGGSYYDWIETIYDNETIAQTSTPVYMGGLSKELVFQEVISNSATQTETGGTQPLGQLAGRGIMGGKHKGGKVRVKVSEPSYITGYISLTPRVDYSQGNKWDVNLKSLDDFHKPALDEIGYQDLITDQMAWWDTVNTPDGVEFKSAGKQPAWMNYMTNVNQTRGNFAIADNEMFMTLNRRYEYSNISFAIADLTTYVDPAKFNWIFAETALDAQNFWAQIKVDITARRKMSAKIMPNL